MTDIKMVVMHKLYVNRRVFLQGGISGLNIYRFDFIVRRGTRQGICLSFLFFLYIFDIRLCSDCYLRNAATL